MVDKEDIFTYSFYMLILLHHISINEMVINAWMDESGYFRAHSVLDFQRSIGKTNLSKSETAKL